MYRCIVILSVCAVALAEPPVPQGLYGAPSSQYGAPSSQYGAPGGLNTGGAGGRFPSSQYGAPGFGGAGGNTGAGGYGGGRDPRDNPMFTHEQDFQRPRGEVWGKWTVALPDGRVQRVEYDADDTGFHPVITYDDPAAGAGGRGSGQGGYRYR